MALMVKDILPYLDENTPVFIVDNSIRFNINGPRFGKLYRFVDRISGITGGGIEICLEKEDWE